ncbi:MAG: STAS domain-containing protein [Planctomycetia bacterium]|nr:STAS domain-containing protein [Planctomycetia bacterium]
MSENARYIRSRYEQGILVIEVIPKRLSEEPQVFALRDEMIAAIRESDSDDIIIDMKNVEYLTSIALLPFVGIRSAAEQRGGRVVLAEPAGIVVDVLTVSQLIVESREHANYLQMADSLESAIALLKRSPDNRV